VIGSLLAVLALTAAFAVAGPVIARRVHPALAIRMLVPASIAIAAASTFALAVAAFTLIGQVPEIAELGPWSPTALRADTPIPATAATAGVALLAYLAISVLVLVSRRSVALVSVHRVCGRLGAPGTLIVVESDHPDAFTTPEATGRIIITRGMLNALTPAERDAMLAHEASHLRHRHTWWLLAADLAAAINPTLRPTARALRHTVERWADEDAADAVADRRTVAYAVANAALATDAHRNRPTSVTEATGGDVPARVAALLTPRPRRTRATLAAAAVSMLLLGATTEASLAVQHHAEILFEQAMAGHAPTTHATHPANPRPAVANLRTGGPRR
jgi:hypothetical protein